MATMRRSLPALDRVVYMVSNKIKNLHQPKIIEMTDHLARLNNKRALEIVADIEKYAIGKYPELRLPLKCERPHSTVNSDNIQVGLYFDGVNSPEASRLKLSIVQEEESEKDDLRILERWKMNCMLAMAAGEGFPPIGIAGIEDISSQEKYYP